MTAPTKEELIEQYAAALEKLRAELQAKGAEVVEHDDPGNTDDFLQDDALDDALVKFMVLSTATPEGLAEFVHDQDGDYNMIEDYLHNQTHVLKEMLLADGAKADGDGPAQWGKTLGILKDLEIASAHACADSAHAVLRRMAIAIALEHAIWIRQENPQEREGEEDPNEFVVPVERYQQYEQAYLQGELDPAFPQLSVWELRFVVNGEEPDATYVWGRDFLRNYRPDHILTDNYPWRYSGVVRSDVRYGSQDVKYDKAHLQRMQNIIVNGGVCGRRAFFGRFILRAFGIPTTARPSRGHGALCHYTPSEGWVVNLGGGWGCGWTKTQYHHDVDFLSTTQARNHREAYWKVKRAQWMGDVFGETRIWGEQQVPNAEDRGFWYNMSLQTQCNIIGTLGPNKTPDENDNEDNDGEDKIVTIAEKVLAGDFQPEEANHEDDTIPISAASTHTTHDVHIMNSFRTDGGDNSQIYLPSFHPQGTSVLRGSSWKIPANDTYPGFRLLSGGYGKYEDWGFRVAMGSYEVDKEDQEDNEDDEGAPSCPSEHIMVDLTPEQEDVDEKVFMEFVYIQPGTFVMGGKSESDGRFNCFEVPNHEVQLTKGYYLGQYPVTQLQYEAIMNENPSKSTREPNCPVDYVGENDALEFCRRVVDTIGQDVRLPTEAEWEYACRGGVPEDEEHRWFFGNDVDQMQDYAWCQENAEGHSHQVGLKQPNPFGLFDMYGNVHERIADKYDCDYYQNSPPADPTGPNQGTKSHLEYTVCVPTAGTYALTAKVVTVNERQTMWVCANDDHDGMKTMEMPFTLGQWEFSDPVTIVLQEGENILRFHRDQPPQYGLVIKYFRLQKVPDEGAATAME